MARKKYSPITPWEIAKPLLEEDIVARRVTEIMLPRDVRKLREEYQKCGATFGTNYRRLQKSVRGHRDRAFMDAAAYVHDSRTYGLAKDDPRCWHGSEAESLLKEDVESSLHKKLTPKLLWLSREEYQVFELDVFRPHIHQITRAKLERPYWMVKKKKKKKRYAARLNANNADDCDEIEFEDPFSNT